MYDQTADAKRLKSQNSFLYTKCAIDYNVSNARGKKCGLTNFHLTIFVPPAEKLPPGVKVSWPFLEGTQQNAHPSWQLQGEHYKVRLYRFKCK